VELRYKHNQRKIRFYFGNDELNLSHQPHQINYQLCSVNWIKKNWSNLLFGVIIVLLLVPQTGKPIKTAIHRLIAFSPGVEEKNEREQLQNYNWLLQSLDGNQVNFKEFEGKKILVNFWATWCPPCIAEMPSMQALYDDYGDKAVFLFVTNDDQDAIDKFMAKNNYSFPIYQARTAAPSELQTNSLPTTYVINEEGEILIDKTGAADWNSETVRGLLDQ
jgi:thiol-disulfide isomerase/thioredoxin